MNRPPSLPRWLLAARSWSPAQRLAMGSLGCLGLAILSNGPVPEIANLLSAAAFLLLAALIARAAWRRFRP